MDKIFSCHENDLMSFTFRDLMGIVFKHKRLILSSFLIVTALVSLGMLSLPSVYVSSGKVLINTEQEGIPSFYSGIAAYRDKQQSDPVNRKMETEMELIEARPIAEQVVRELDLQYWDVYHKPYVHLLSPLAELYDKFLYSVFNIAPDPEKRGFRDTVTALIQSLTVEPVKTKSSETTSNLVQLSLKGPNDKITTETLQKIMETYRDHDIAIKRQAAVRASEIVSTKIIDAFQRVQVSQLELKDFLSNRGSITSPSSVLATPRDNETVILLKEQLIEKEMELAEARAGYRANSDKIRKLESITSKLKVRLNDEIIRDADYDSRMSILEGEVATAESVYLDLKKRLSQIELYLGMNDEGVGNRLIVEPAILPRDSRWKKDLVLTVIGSLAGLVLGLGVAGFREYLDHTISREDEIVSFFGLDVLGTITWVDDTSSNTYTEVNSGEKSS